MEAQVPECVKNIFAFDHFPSLSAPITGLARQKTDKFTNAALHGSFGVVGDEGTGR